MAPRSVVRCLACGGVGEDARRGVRGRVRRGPAGGRGPGPAARGGRPAGGQPGRAVPAPHQRPGLRR
ncbi:hypothetical protein EG870_16115, partial [Enterococcus faecalis]